MPMKRKLVAEIASHGKPSARMRAGDTGWRGVVLVAGKAVAETGETFRDPDKARTRVEEIIAKAVDYMNGDVIVHRQKRGIFRRWSVGISDAPGDEFDGIKESSG